MPGSQNHQIIYERYLPTIGTLLPTPKAFRAYTNDRAKLVAFVFVGINQPQRSVDQCCIKTLRFYFGWAHAAFDILVKNFVEYGIVGQAVAVF